MQGEGLAALSTTVSAVEVPPERIAPFDRIVMTDEKFLSIMGIGVHRPGPHGALTPVPAAAIPAAARNYLFGDHGRAPSSMVVTEHRATPPTQPAAPR